VVDEAAVERAVLVLSQVGHASVRGVQESLGEMLGVERSAGWIEGVLQEAARLTAVPEGPRQVAADEVYAAGQPVLEVVEPRNGRVRTGAEVRADLEAAATLLRAAGGRATEAATLLEHRAVGLTAYLADLDQALAAPRAVLPPDTIAFVAWAWRHQRAFDLRDAAEAWLAAPTAARWVWAALDGTVRASSMVENLNSALDPHRAAQRGLPWPILAVWRVYRNYHVFTRGKRAGHSPLDLAGLPAPHRLDALGYGRLTAPAPSDFPAWGLNIFSGLGSQHLSRDNPR